MFNIFDVETDSVISAVVGLGKTSYGVALDMLYPLINQLPMQRKLQDVKFYDRLKRDILAGCIMPPITIAFVVDDEPPNFDANALSKYMEENIGNAFILDGIQRLNTLHRAYSEVNDEFPRESPIFFTALVCKTMDSLLYRMITLNNGQKPMTTRHQIEVITENLYDFSEFESDLKTERSGSRKRGLFKRSDFVLAYLAFLSGSTTVDSQKLIEEKLDQLIAFKILESAPAHGGVEFSAVLNLISSLSQDQELRNWLRNSNNLIGFCSGIRRQFGAVEEGGVDGFKELLEQFEPALASFQVSKIKLGQARRDAVHLMISRYSEFMSMSNLEMVELLAKHL